MTIQNSKYPEILFNLPHPDPTTGRKFSRGDFQNKVYPVLAAVAPYNEYLDKDNKITRNVISALQNGLVSKECSRTCIVALTACSLEMTRTMYYMIEKVLFGISKISATKHVATPMLEFLSTLIRLPDIFSSFTDTNYMSVFAIALPFTNPFKFDPYTVSLAHHVIIMWFLKCRLAYRQRFHNFIIKGLDSNVIKSFEEGGFRRDRSNTGAASDMTSTSKLRAKSGSAGVADAARLRSNSLSDNAALKAKERHATGSAGVAASAATSTSSTSSSHQDKMLQFHQELNETCEDMLGTYMFANVAPKPKRLPTAEFLLKGGQSASWVVGTKIITITTSICDLNSNRGGLCDRCLFMCNKTGDGSTRSDSIDSTSSSVEKRHKSSEAAAASTGSDSLENRKRHMSDAQVGGGSPLRPTTLIRRGSFEKPQPQPPRPPVSSKPPEQMTNLETLMDKQKDQDKKKPDLCSCWCTGWAEVHVRRPSGDVSWMFRVQNPALASESFRDFPLRDLTAIFHPDKEDNKEIQLVAGGEDEVKENVGGGDHDPAHGLDSLTDAQGASSFSVFARKRTDSDASSSAPPSPTKTPSGSDLKLSVKEEDSNDQEASASKPQLAKTLSSPEKLSADAHAAKSNLDVPTSKSNRQSCDPIPELDEEVPRPLVGLDRRPSLQPLGLGDHQKSLLNKPYLATPPRTPHSRDSPGPAAMRNRSDSGSAGKGDAPSEMRKRAQTISGPSPARRPTKQDYLKQRSTSGTGSTTSLGSKGGASEGELERVTGISPQFVFLSLYHSSTFGAIQPSEKPLAVPSTSKSIESSIRILDRIYPYVRKTR